MNDVHYKQFLVMVPIAAALTLAATVEASQFYRLLITCCTQPYMFHLVTHTDTRHANAALSWGMFGGQPAAWLTACINWC